MSTVNPKREEFVEQDHFKVAKDVAWVIKSLWVAAAAIVLATMWVAALAADVKSNTAKVSEAATHEQMTQVLEGIKDIKANLKDADERQRDIKSQVDKLESQVEEIKKRDE